MTTTDNATGSTSLLADRRRPGRPAHVSPGLVPLLRGQWRDLPNPSHRSNDDLRAARGIAVAVAVCAAFWAGVVALIG